jgi:hypothetical protein
MILLGGFFMTSCQLFKSLKITEMKEVHVYHMAERATKPEDQDSSKTYLVDFEVLKEIETGDKGLEILAALESKDNIDAVNSKRCMFQPRYGLEADGTIYLVSLEPCMKYIVKEPQEANGRMFDMTVNNTIVPLFQEVYPLH